jgi:hypothetical protein
MSEPVTAIPLQYQTPIETPRRRWLSIAWWAVLIAWPACLVAWIFIFVDTETVVGTGPVIFLLAILAVIGGIVHRDWWLMVVGLWHAAICLLFVALVNLRNWSPEMAHNPFLVMGAFHLFLTLAPTVYALWGRMPTDDLQQHSPPPRDLSPDLRLLYEYELSLGNAVVRIDRNLWSGCPLAVIFRDPLHLDEAAAALSLPPTVTRWENRDTHYDLEAGWRCQSTRHSLSGPLPQRA